MERESNGNKLLYIPLEIYSRELNGMLLLSTIAANNGWKIIIAGKSILFPVLDRFPPGIVLLKSIVPGEISIQQKLINLGHKVASLDAEGLVPSNGVAGVKLRFSDQTINLAEKVFFWGLEQFAQVANVYPGIKRNGVVTGSPIFDYWKLLGKSNNQKINSKQTVLIATSFPYPNHFVDKNQPYRAIRDASGINSCNEHLDELYLEGKLQEVVYPHFMQMVSDIAERMQDIRFILRPHPSESRKQWELIANKHNNIELQYEGDIAFWLQRSGALIHFNSTTSIEAFVYGKKVITYIPPLDDELFAKLSDKPLLVSTVCRDVNDVYKQIQALRFENITNDLGVIRHFVQDSDTETPFSGCKNIINQLDTIAFMTAEKFPGRLTLILNFSLIVEKFKNRIIWLLGWLDYFFNIFSGKYKHTRKRYQYGRSKQGALPLSRIVEKLARIHEETGYEVSVRQLKSALFIIENINSSK